MDLETTYLLVLASDRHLKIIVDYDMSSCQGNLENKPNQHQIVKPKLKI